MGRKEIRFAEVIFLMTMVISFNDFSFAAYNIVEPTSMPSKRIDHVQSQLVDDDSSSSSDIFNELSTHLSGDNNDINFGGPKTTRRKRFILGTVVKGIFNLFKPAKPKPQDPMILETNAKLNSLQNSIQIDLKDIKDMNAQLGRNQKNLGSYVTGMNVKLNSIQSSLSNIKVINGKLDNIENSLETNKRTMTAQLQVIQKNLGSIQEMNDKLDSNQKSLDNYVKGIVNGKLDSIQKNLGDYMKSINGKLEIIQKNQDINKKAIDRQLNGVQDSVKDLKGRIQGHFKDLDDNMNRNLESVKHDLQEAFEVQKKQLAINQLKTEFSKYERIIEDSLRYSILYRKTNSTTSRTAFLKFGSQLESAIDAILDGLLGGGIFGSDILIAIRTGKNNHPTEFIQAYQDIRDLLGVAAGVLVIYYKTSKADQGHIDLWKEEMEVKESGVTNRVREMELDCRTEGQNVVDDVKRIMAIYANETSNQVSKRIYDHLSDKYNTSLWCVIANRPWMEKEKPVFSNYRRRVEVFDFQGKSVIAYSFDHNDMAMSISDGCQDKLKELYWHVNVQNPPTFNEWRNDRLSNRNERCGSAKEIYNHLRNIDGMNSDHIIEVVPHEDPLYNSRMHSSNCDFRKRVHCFSRNRLKDYYYDIFIFPGGKSSRKYFKIVSQLDGMVVEASTLSSKLPGGHIHLKPDSDGAHQFWYLESKSQSIRSMQTDLCLTSSGSDQAYLNWCDTSPSDQQLWRLIKDDTIVSWANSTQCLQVQEYSDVDTPRITEGNCTGDLNQKFTIKY